MEVLQILAERMSFNFELYDVPDGNWGVRDNASCFYIAFVYFLRMVIQFIYPNRLSNIPVGILFQNDFVSFRFRSITP